mmetsp:Transcript_27481/g.69907  ORF Transcript_27481/g.69907 Transcript_27481/m.69907 type:complete len:155 (-) Transcript_27481:1323-1787(-)
MALSARSISARVPVRAGRKACVQVKAGGRQFVTKKGVAFTKSPVPEPEPEQSEEIGALGYGAIAAGAVANPIMLWSAVTLATTGSGLPEGPGGALGAAEGISYLVVLGLIAWSLYTKVSTGKGLPAGPSGLLGAVEGVSYLSLLGAIVAFIIKP